METSCSRKDRIVYKAVWTLLTQVDITEIRPNDPLASGVLDLTKLGDSHMGQLKEDVVKLLTASVFVKEVNLPNEAQQLLDEFVDSYKHLGTKFRLSDMDGISFPVGIKNPQLKADMGMLWSVLNGL